MVRGAGTETMCVTDSDAAYIVDRFKLGGRSRHEHEANARLMAAAPDLLAACKSVGLLLTSFCDAQNLSSHQKDRVVEELLLICDATAKAEGRTK
jgi:hypothetical protein